MLTPSKTQSILSEMGHTPDKNLGQNFLIDSNIIRKSIELATVETKDTILEIGPGLGTLTLSLLEKGCKLYAVEKDPRLYERLSAMKKKKSLDQLTLTYGDAMQFPKANIPEDVTNFKIVANLPYSITTPWIEKILSNPLPKIMVLMVQKEAADRLTALPNTKNFSAISILLQASYKRLKGHAVSKKCFLPEPKVDSTLLVLERKENFYLFDESTRTTMRIIFTKRRKQIKSILKAMETHKEILEIWLKKLPSETMRPDTIFPEYWIDLDNMIKKSTS
jgi:16S rRNA (adenine1518-N6/adenine1519-N6)-dimethyltransferase